MGWFLLVRFWRKTKKPRLNRGFVAKLGSSGRPSVARPRSKLPRSRYPNKSVIGGKSAAWSKSCHQNSMFEAFVLLSNPVELLLQ
jgi:hypothetical protein